MSEVTVRLTEDGPIRYSGGGLFAERGEEVTTSSDFAEHLVANHGFEYVGCECSDSADCSVPGCDAEPEPEADDDPTCAGNDGECSRTVDEPGGYCWQHGGD